MFYLWNMALSGSCMSLLYAIVNKTIGKYCSSRQKYFLLKAVLLYYVLPLFPIKNFYRDTYVKIGGEWVARRNKAKISHGLIQNKYVWVTNAEGFTYPNAKLALQLTIFICCILIAVGILLFRIIKYIRFRREIEAYILLFRTRELQIHKMIDNLRCEYHIRRKIEVCVVPDAMHCTIGVVCPVIILGKFPKDIKDLELILRHELIHIKQFDFLVRAIGEFAFVLHWVNPLVHWVRREVSKATEYACDEQIVYRIPFEERKRYARLIATQKGTMVSQSWSSSIAGETSTKKERIAKIMLHKKRKRGIIAITSSLIGMLVFLNTMTVFAYESAVSAKTEETGLAHFYSDHCFILLDGGEVPDKWKEDRVLYDRQFIDEDGNIIPLSEPIQQIYRTCSHKYENGIYMKHEKKSDESCVIYKYEAKKCIHCGNCIIGKLVGTSTDNPCPH